LNKVPAVKITSYNKLKSYFTTLLAKQQIKRSKTFSQKLDNRKQQSLVYGYVVKNRMNMVKTFFSILFIGLHMVFLALLQKSSSIQNNFSQKVYNFIF